MRGTGRVTMLRIVALAIVSIAAACGPRAASSSGPRPAGPPAPDAADAPASDVTPAPLVPCPPDEPREELDQLVAGLLAQPVDHVETLLCAAGHFPAPGWMVWAWVVDPEEVEEDPSSDRERHVLVVDSASRTAMVEIDVGTDNGVGILFGRPRVVDLDGDGIDEVAVEGSYGESGYDDSWLEVWRLVGSDAERAGENIPLDSEGYDVEDCKATVEIRPAGSGAELVVTRALVPAESPGDGNEKPTCTVGSFTYRMRAGRIEEVH